MSEIAHNFTEENTDTWRSFLSSLFINFSPSDLAVCGHFK